MSARIGFYRDHSGPQWPTCKSCPFWRDNDEELLYHECIRFPPTQVVLRSFNDGCGGDYRESVGSAVLTAEDDFCGEHPDFPAWVALMRAHFAESKGQEAAG